MLVSVVFLAGDGRLGAGAELEDPMPALLVEMDEERLMESATDLVTRFGPRHLAHRSLFVDDQCIPSSNV